MPIHDREVRKIAVFAIIIALFFLSYLVMRPLLLSAITGFLLAYAFYPIYRGLFKVFGEKNTTSLAVVLLVLLVLIVPIWFLIPALFQQAFDMFTLLQGLDIASFVKTILPGSSLSLQTNIASSIISFIGKITNGVLTSIASLLFDLPTILLHITVVLFVFFYGLRDAERINQYINEISPLRKEHQKTLIAQFKGMTSSIIYGQILLGIIQGLITGIGLLVFGVPKVLLLTVIAVVAGVLPVLGPWLVWIPAAIYLFSTGNMNVAIGFTVYSVIFASLLEMILRPVIVSRRTKVPSAIILIGTLGGLMVFGTVGILIGPLILAYALLFLEAYKNKTLSEMFSSD